ncbi:MAG TPA: hypothetical protein PLG75_03455 [Methanoculleus sp.]|nr:hypothetical protein [Methanoculleus sp.]
MNTWTCSCLVAGLLLLAAPAGALVPDTIMIDTEPLWVTVGSGDTAFVTVTALNGSSTPVPGAAVVFTVSGTDGSILPVQEVTGGDGNATAVFTPGTQSGDATITARFSSRDREVSNTAVCRIDHAAPYAIADILYEPEVTVGKETAITVRVADRYGNPVDSRREDALNTTPETVYFMVGSPTGNATFSGAEVPDEISVPVDAAGNATATLRVDTAAGENIIWIRTPVGEQRIFIIGVADGEPCAIKVDVQPDEGEPPRVYAGSNSRFFLTYTLLDEFGNPSPEQELVITTNISGEETRVTTNAYGRAQVSYGPRVTPGGVTITATAVNNTSVACSQPLAFVTSTPTNLYLSANPETMPSRDVPGCKPAEIRAKLVDQYGNPVAGKEISFSIVDTVVEADLNQTTEPEFTTTDGAMTDSSGIATIGFWPGEFTADYRAPGYSPTANGTCRVVARYGEDIFGDVSLTWKNYPYLSVETHVTPDVVAVNDTVDVTIRLRGDGWALKPDPIDVILCIDRGARMVDGDEDHMVTVMEAAPVFIDQMFPGWDRVGLVSFGANGTVRISTESSTLENKYFKGGIGTDNNKSDDGTYISEHYPGPNNASTCNYIDHATLDVPLTSTAFDDVRGGIAALLPSGGNPIRKGLYESIKVLRDDGRKNAVKAVVILGDSKYDWYGDPLAGGNSQDKDPEKIGQTTEGWYSFADLNGTDQNMSAFAKNCNVSIYAITYSPDDSTFMDRNMQILAEGSGGKYYKASTKEKLIEVYKQIADDLKTEAGVDTKLDVSFENVEVNGAVSAGSEADVFDYVYEDGVSTTVASWVDNETGHYEIIPRYTRDDTPNWTASPPHLSFEIGTIHLGQTWEATFRLKVLKEGTINIFGSGSTITFNDGEDTLHLPDTIITVTAANNTGMGFAVLEITNLRFTGEEPVERFLPVAWDLNYTGSATVTEDVFYSNDNEYTWVRFDRISATNTTTGGEATLDVQTLPAGLYTIRVDGYAPDTGDASARLPQEVAVGVNRSVYIRIE